MALPYGKSIFTALAAADPTPAALQAVYCSVAVLSVLLLPLLPALLIRVVGIDGTWDARHGGSGVVDLLRATLGTSDTAVVGAAGVTAAVYGALLILDVLSGCVSRISWPAAWHCENTRCYDEMFCEPARANALVRRPGNAYSNCLYLFDACIVLVSIDASSPFALADALFGGMLLLLSIFSTLWHASHAPKVHYLDLWAMDSCIAYLLVRIACVGGGVAFIAQPWNLPGGAHAAAGAACALLYGLVIASNGRKQAADSAVREELIFLL